MKDLISNTFFFICIAYFFSSFRFDLNTLITLGTLGAFVLFLYLEIKGVEYNGNHNR